MSGPDVGRRSPRLVVREVRRTHEHLVAYRLRYEHPEHDADDRGLFTFHERGLVMDPWDVRGALTFVAWRGSEPAGTLRLILRRPMAFLRSRSDVRQDLMRRIGGDGARALRSCGILSRAAVAPPDALRRRALRALLVRAEEAARAAGLEVLLARARRDDPLGHEAFQAAGFDALRSGLRFKRLADEMPVDVARPAITPTGGRPGAAVARI